MKQRKNSAKINFITSLFCTLISICAFSATSYAFFVDSVTTSFSKVESGYYHLSADINFEIANGAHDYTLSSGMHEVVLTAEGTTTGFAILTVDGNTYYSQQINAGQSISLYLDCTTAVEVSYDYQWGYLPNDVISIASGTTITL